MNISDDRRRELLIEESFPDGKARSGFNYMFTTDGAPNGMILFEVKLHDETLRLFFNAADFTAFAHEVFAVVKEITKEQK